MCFLLLFKLPLEGRKLNSNEKKYIEFIFEYLEKVCGLYFNSDEMFRKHYIVEDRLRLNSITSFQKYYQFLSTNSREAKKEVQTLINEITNNNTSFFRYKPSFELLDKIILPELFTSRFVQNNDVIRIWSAGCSTGEEAYSIAISCLEALPDSNPVKIEIIATDISTDNIVKAQQGYFSRSKVSSLPENLMERYFSERIEENGILSYATGKTLKKLISFKYLNLVDSNVLFPGNLDIIFCRNVFPYLKHDFVIDILKKFHECLTPGGYLFTTATDHPVLSNELFELVSYKDSSCYKKRSNKTLDKINTSIPSKNRIFTPHPVLNKKRLGKKEHKIARVKNFISRLDAAHNLKETNNNIQSLDSNMTYFGFKLIDKLFCIDVKDVREVIHAGFITSVPSSPSFVKGIMNYRGEVITLVDISRFLKLKEKALHEYDHIHILVLNKSDSLMGIIISSSFITFAANEKYLNTMPDIAVDYVQGVFDVNDESYMLLKLNDLISIEILDMNK